MRVFWRNGRWGSEKAGQWFGRPLIGFVDGVCEAVDLGPS